MLTFLKNQKTHVFYVFLILALFGIGSWLFKTHPREIIKTVTQTKVVNRDVVKVQKQYIDRVIVDKKKDGDVVTTTEHVSNDDTTTDKSKIATTFISKTDIKYLSRYTLGTYYTIPLHLTSFSNMNPFASPFDPQNLTLMGGIRIFNSPIFFNLGTNGLFNQILVGFTIEF